MDLKKKKPEKGFSGIYFFIFLKKKENHTHTHKKVFAFQVGLPLPLSLNNLFLLNFSLCLSHCHLLNSFVHWDGFHFPWSACPWMKQTLTYHPSNLYLWSCFFFFQSRNTMQFPQHCVDSGSGKRSVSLLWYTTMNSNLLFGRELSWNCPGFTV